MDLKLKLPPDYSKLCLVIADCRVEAAREFWGEAVEVIPLSETYLPTDEATTTETGSMIWRSDNG